MSITILDGGMGQELVARSDVPPTPLWSTDVMRANPSLVGDIHAEFFAAGAQIATTNTYAIHRDRLVRAGEDDALEGLYDMALTQAEAARDAHGAGLIAGSIGPLGASYRSDVQPDHIAAVGLYSEVAGLLAPRVDLFLCETIASIAQLKAVLEATLPYGLPIWLAFTVDDTDGTRLRSGEALSDAIAGTQGVAALLANCSTPEAMPAALAILAKSSLPFGAYANGFTQISATFLEDAPTVDALTSRQDLGPAVYADHAATWVELGATIIGGCCEVGPAHIAELSARFGNSG